MTYLDNKFRTMRLLIPAFISLTLSCASARKPNVIIFFTDDQGTLDAGCYGSSDLITPNIDKLAKTGLRFTQAYAHTVCCPARAALLTGRHPQRSGVNRWTQGDMKGAKGINMALEEVTIAESLKQNGYRTALFGKWHLGAHRDFGPKKQGFDEFFGLRDGFIDNYNHYFLHGQGFHDLYEGTTSVKADGQYFPELMTRRSLSFIEENKDRPFFLYLPFNIPHYPEQAPKEFAAPFQDMKDPARKSYATIMHATDHYIGKVLSKLESLNLRQNSIIIFMSDNGHSEETGNRIRVDNHKSGHPKGHFYGASGGGYTGKWKGNKGNFLEGGIRVPAIISYPGVLPADQTRNQPITIMDWFPTILELCAIKSNPENPELDGFSLSKVFASEDAKTPNQVMHWGWFSNWAVRIGEWKLISRGNWDWSPGDPLPKSTQLVSLNDPAPERENHAAARADVLLRLKKAHDHWAQQVGFSGK